jgi:hypothetical protein
MSVEIEERTKERSKCAYEVPTGEWVRIDGDIFIVARQGSNFTKLFNVQGWPDTVNRCCIVETIDVKITIFN